MGFILGYIYKMQIDKQDIVLESLRDCSYLVLCFLCFSLFLLLQGLGKILTELEMLVKNKLKNNM